MLLECLAVVAFLGSLIRSVFLHFLLFRFCTKETNADGISVDVLQLALTVADATGSTVVYLNGEEAERYLDTTAAFLAAHPAAREEVQRRLEALRDQKIFSEFKVRVYVDKTTVPLPVPEQPKKRGRPSNNSHNGSRQQDSQLTYVRYDLFLCQVYY